VLAAVVLIAAGACAVFWADRHRRGSARCGIEAYREIIWRHARQKALPTELVESVILAESSGNPTAVSHKNARGLMQITPITVREVRRRTGMPKGDLFDPEYNIDVGTCYLRLLMDRFDGKFRLVVAAYHMGPTRLAKLRRAHPDLPARRLIARHAPRSTVKYCQAVLGKR